MARTAALAAFALPGSTTRPAQPGPRRPQRALHTVLGIVGSFRRSCGGGCRRLQQLVRIVGLVLARPRRARRFARRGIRRLRVIAVGVVSVGVAVAIGLSDVAARRLLMPAVRWPVLLVSVLLMALLLTAALAVATLTLLAHMALLAALTLAALTLAALIAGIRAIAQAGVGAALRIGSAGGIERGGQALAHVLHIDVGDGQFAPAHARTLAVIHRAQHTIVMVGMLQEILRGDPIARRSRIACELQIFFQDLEGIAPDPHFLPAAIVSLTLVLAPAHPVGLARTAPAGASVVIVLFHV